MRTVLSLFLILATFSTVSFDGRRWGLATEEGGVRKYFLADQKPDYWKEMIVVEVDKSGTNPATLAGSFLTRYRSGCGVHFAFEILESDGDGLFVEWAIAGLPEKLRTETRFDQYRLMRIYRDGPNTITVSYVTKNLDDVEAKRAEWIQALKTFHL